MERFPNKLVIASNQLLEKRTTTFGPQSGSSVINLSNFGVDIGEWVEWAIANGTINIPSTGGSTDTKVSTVTLTSTGVPNVLSVQITDTAGGIFTDTVTLSSQDSSQVSLSAPIVVAGTTYTDVQSILQALSNQPTASDITVADTAGNFTATDVEGVLAELATDSHADDDVETVSGTAVDNTDARNPVINLQTALQTTVADVASNYTGSNVEDVLAEIATSLTGLVHTSITAIDLKPTANPNEYTVEISWTDENGTTQVTTDSTPVTLSGGGITNLSYTPSPTEGTVTSSTGTDATIPVVDATNAGLATPDMLSKSHDPVTLTAQAQTNGLSLSGQKINFDTTSLPTYTVGTSSSVNNQKSDYLATGTNDEIQIQAAINAAAMAGGGRVYLLEGTYNLSNQVNLPSDKRIYLEGQSLSTILNIVGGDKGIYTQSSAFAGSSFPEEQRISNLAFTSTVPANAIHVSLKHLLTVDNCHFTGKQLTGYYSESANNCTITECMFNDVFIAIHSERINEDFDDFRIVNNDFSYSERQAILLDASTWVSSTQIDKVIIMGNIFEENSIQPTYPSIEIRQGRHVNIIGNSITQNRNGEAIILKDGQNNSVVNNLIAEIGTDVPNTRTGVILVNENNSKVDSNVFALNFLTGIDVQGGVDNELFDNQFNGITNKYLDTGTNTRYREGLSVTGINVGLGTLDPKRSNHIIGESEVSNQDDNFRRGLIIDPNNATYFRLQAFDFNTATGYPLLINQAGGSIGLNTAYVSTEDVEIGGRLFFSNDAGQQGLLGSQEVGYYRLDSFDRNVGQAQELRLQTNGGDLFIGAGTGNTQVRLVDYINTNYDAIPVSYLGVDANGYVVKNTITSSSFDLDWIKSDGSQATDINDTIYTLGSVGIGLTTPNEVLEVSGRSFFGDGAGPTRKGLLFNQEATYFRMDAFDYGVGIGQQFRLNTNGGELFLGSGTGTSKIRFLDYINTINHVVTNTSGKHILVTDDATGYVERVAVSNLGLSSDGDAWAVTGEDVNSNVTREGSASAGAVNKTYIGGGTFGSDLALDNSSATLAQWVLRNSSTNGTLTFGTTDTLTGSGVGTGVDSQVVFHTDGQVQLAGYIATTFDNPSPVKYLTLDSSGNITRSDAPAGDNMGLGFIAQQAGTANVTINNTGDITPILRFDSSDFIFTPFDSNRSVDIAINNNAIQPIWSNVQSKPNLTQSGSGNVTGTIDLSGGTFDLDVTVSTTPETYTTVSGSGSNIPSTTDIVGITTSGNFDLIISTMTTGQKITVFNNSSGTVSLGTTGASIQYAGVFVNAGSREDLLSGESMTVYMPTAGGNAVGWK